MKRILVTGANGQLGTTLKQQSLGSEDQWVFCGRNEMDITKTHSIASFLENQSFDFCINCAAYTAVDKAEEQQGLADAVNHLAVANFAQLAKDYNINLIHISTDYVFDGTKHKPYLETDTPNPKSVYGQTKLDGELAIQRINPANSVIIRTSWVYSRFGSNFVKTMLHLAKERDEISVVADQIGSPTNAADLAQTILQILPKVENKTVEIYHYANEGFCSWAKFSNEIFKLLNIDCRVNKLTTAEYPTKAKRPKYSVMETRKIKQVYEVRIPMWEVSLEKMLKVKS